MTGEAEVARRALALLDLTNLDETCAAGDIVALCDAAFTPHGPVAAICIYPRWVAFARAMLGGRRMRIATVANFPHGGSDASPAVRETVRAIEEGADEIDVVLPWRALLAGDRIAPANLVAACRAVIPKEAKLKVILETGELGGVQAIREAAAVALDNGADFLKTSTGKVKVNATPEAAELLLGAIRDSGLPVGFKAAGGIRTVADAAAYLDIAGRIVGPNWATPATFRIGASGLLKRILATLDGTAPAASAGY